MSVDTNHIPKCKNTANSNNLKENLISKEEVSKERMDKMVGTMNLIAEKIQNVNTFMKVGRYYISNGRVPLLRRFHLNFLMHYITYR